MFIKTSKIIFFNLLIFVILLIFSEILSGNLIFKKKLDCVYLLCERKFLIETNFHYNLPNYVIDYQRDEFGFRDRESKFSDIDILTIGGSTTDERFIKDEDTWSKKLENRLSIYLNKQIDVVNAGIDGQSTNGHIWNFNNWFNQLDNFRPKYIIFYIGLNEILYQLPENYKRTYDNYYDFSKLNFSNKFKFIIKKNNGIFFKSYLIFYRKFFLRDKFNTSHLIDRKNSKYSEPYKKFILNEETRKIFINNLNILYKKSIMIESIPIFITQKTLRGKYENNKILSIDSYDYFTFENNISNIVIDFCTQKKIKCLDGNKNFNFILNDTYDLFHLSPSGSEKLSRFIFDELKNYIKI